MQIDVNAIIGALRDQTATDYGRMNVDLAVLRAENAALQQRVAELEGQLRAQAPTKEDVSAAD